MEGEGGKSISGESESQSHLIFCGITYLPHKIVSSVEQHHVYLAHIDFPMPMAFFICQCFRSINNSPPTDLIKERLKRLRNVDNPSHEFFQNLCV